MRNEEHTTIQQFLIQCAEQISMTFGVYCETAVYHVTEENNRILAIYNRKVTNRKIGDSYVQLLDTEDRELVQRMTQDFSKGVCTSNVYVYRTDGKLLKVTTSHYKTESEWYALSIVFDDTVLAMAESALRSLNQSSVNQEKTVDPDVQRLEELFEDCHMIVGTPIYMMGKSERMQMVQLLKERNAFSFQKSIPYVASRLHISRYSIYNYLKELGGANGE